MQLDQAEARKLLAVGRHAVLPEQLVAAADREHDGAAIDRRANRLDFVPSRVGEDQFLVAVLAAAPEDEVDVGEIGRWTPPDGSHLDGDPAPFASPLKR